MTMALDSAAALGSDMSPRWPRRFVVIDVCSLETSAE
jgi:hypothetical protein